MLMGLVDVGSNTIRLVVARLEKGTFREVFSQREYVGLVGFVAGGRLEPAGEERLLETLSAMAAFSRMAGCQRIDAFATAALRKVEEPAPLLRRIFQNTGLELRILSGEEEARYDLLGLRWETGARMGTGLDLGGGSCQVFSFREGELEEGASLPCGALALYRRFVSGVIPTSRERRAIRRYVQEELARCPALQGAGRGGVWGMGGTARAALKVWRALSGEEASLTLTLSQLKELGDLPTHMGLEGIKLLGKLAPQRLTSLLPGVEALRCILEHLEARELTVLRSGVREGYLWQAAREEGTD